MSYLALAKKAEEKIKRGGGGAALPPQEQPKAIPGASGAQQDPILAVGLWYPEFHKLHVAIAEENPDFDRLWLKQHKPTLYQNLKAKEDEIDCLGGARLSQVVAIMREWRELVLKAEFQRREAESKGDPVLF